MWDLSVGGHVPPEDTLDKTCGFCPCLGKLRGGIGFPSRKAAEFFGSLESGKLSGLSLLYVVK